MLSFRTIQLIIDSFLEVLELNELLAWDILKAVDLRDRQTPLYATSCHLATNRLICIVNI